MWQSGDDISSGNLVNGSGRQETSILPLKRGLLEHWERRRWCTELSTDVAVPRAAGIHRGELLRAYFSEIPQWREPFGSAGNSIVCLHGTPEGQLTII